jgi:hypothetical protein
MTGAVEVEEARLPQVRTSIEGMNFEKENDLLSSPSSSSRS